MSYLPQAIYEADGICDDFNRADGLHYTVYTKVVGRICFLDIMCGDQQVESFAAESWKKMRDMLRCARTLAWTYVNRGVR